MQTINTNLGIFLYNISYRYYPHTKTDGLEELNLPHPRPVIKENICRWL